MSNQGRRQASIRAITGTALDYNGDFMALFDLAGIPAGDFNSRFLAWINLKLASAYDNLPSAMQALAAANSAYNFNSMSTFDAASTYPQFAPGAKLISVGDSIIQYGNLADSAKVSNQADSIVNWAICDRPTFQHAIWYDAGATGGASPPLFRGANFGLAGDTATDVTERIAPIVNIDADVCILSVGTNVGATDSSVATTIASIQSIIDSLTPQTVVILCTIFPRAVSLTPTGVELSPAEMQRILDINAIIRTMGNGEDVFIADPWYDMIDTQYSPTDDLYGNPKAGVTRDGVHLEPYGAWLAARGGTNSINTLLGRMCDTDLYADTWFNSDPKASGNRITNGEFASAGGTCNLGMTGQVSSTWTASCASGVVSGVASWSENAETSAGRLTFVFTSTGLGVNANNFEQCLLQPQGTQVNEPAIANGAWCKLFFKVSVSGNTQKVLSNIRAELRNSTTAIYGYGNEETDANRANSVTHADDWGGWIISEAVQYNTSDVFIPRLLFDIRDDIASTVTIVVDACLLLEVTAPATTFPYTP